MYGIICGHDYCENDINNGVTKVVDEIFGHPDKIFNFGNWLKFL